MITWILRAHGVVNGLRRGSAGFDSNRAIEKACRDLSRCWKDLMPLELSDVVTRV